MTRKYPVPDHLQPETAAWYTTVCGEYQLEDHHRRLLRLAAEAWDRCQQARQALADNGMVYDDRFGTPKARPEVAIERDSRIAFSRMIRELGLDLAEPETPKPPTIQSRA